jgi:hypothetical protein
MAIEIGGVFYFNAADINREIGVARQTLWRWRQEKCIPSGQRYRGRQIVFTLEEVEAIRQYANRLEPAAPLPVVQPIRPIAAMASNKPKAAANPRRKHESR